MTAPTITQADRQAALDCLMHREDFSARFQSEMLGGLRDESLTIRAFAKHREAAVTELWAEVERLQALAAMKGEG